MSKRRGAKSSKPPADLSNLLPEEQMMQHIQLHSKVSLLNQLIDEYPDIDVNHLVFPPDITDEELDNNPGILPVDNPLTLACKHGNLNAVKWLIEKECDKYVRIENNNTVFHIAAEKNQDSLFRILLDDESDIDLNDMQNDDEVTPFQIALMKNMNSNICSMCVRKGTVFDFSKKGDTNGRMIIHTTAYDGNVKLMECLLNLGDDPYKVDGMGNTLLHCVFLNPKTKNRKQIIDFVNKKVKMTNELLNHENNDGDTVLDVCLGTNEHFDLAKSLLKLGCDINHISKVTGLGMIHRSVCLGDVKHLTDLLSNFKFKINLKDQNGNNVLHYCTDDSIARLLVEKKVEINGKNNAGYTPLATYVVHGKNNMVDFIVGEKKVNLTIKTKAEQNIFHICAKYGRAEMLKKFFSSFPKSQSNAPQKMMEEKDINGLSPLQVAIAERQEDVAIIFIQKDANVVIPDKNLLHDAVKQGLSNLVAEIISKKQAQEVSILINKLDANKASPLHDAVANDDIVSVRALLSVEDLLLDIVDEKRNLTPLMIACRNGFSEIALLLVNSRADPNFSDENDRIALHYASSSKNVEVCRVLIENGSMLNKVDKLGRTPLHEACSVNNDVVVDYLLKDNRGVEIELKDKNGFTPLHVAVASGAEEATKKLVDKGAKLNICDKFGRTPLMLASETKNTECGRILIRHARIAKVTKK